MSQGAIKVFDDYKGLAYKDYVSVTLDEVDEYALVVCKEYNMSYEYAMDKLYYSDLTVMYAKIANDKAFQSYNDYLSLDEKAQSHFVADYGKPKSYVFSLITPELQQKNVEQRESALRELYRQGGRLDE